ncbi:MAG: hypothetical protein LiPW31_114 [Microgenomates group bacterium LiPW_31]|nr:MAG: hypothetical protein LiPW31_114 [Microgenomates group bacterium LiPW_31]
MKNQKGFLLIEVVIVVLIVVIMTGVIAFVGLPLIQKVKKEVRVEHDCQIIAAGIYKFNGDVKEWPIWKNGAVTNPADGGSSAGRVYNVLRSDGTMPACDEINALSSEWADANYDTLKNQLAWGAPAGDKTKKYSGFRGPYLDPTADSKDPWGNPYLINCKYWQPEHSNNKKMIFILSAGPNEVVETDFSQDFLEGGPGGGTFAVGGDDIIYVFGAS